MTEFQSTMDAEELLDSVLGLIRSREDGISKMRTRLCIYDEKDGVKLVGITMCPHEIGQTISLDTIKTGDLFDRLISCDVSTFEVDHEGSRMAPQLRVLGDYKDLTIMMTIYLKKVTFP